jgi:hypothetical protein
MDAVRPRTGEVVDEAAPAHAGERVGVVIDQSGPALPDGAARLPLPPGPSDGPLLPGGQSPTLPHSGGAGSVQAAEEAVDVLAAPPPPTRQSNAPAPSVVAEGEPKQERGAS